MGRLDSWPLFTEDFQIVVNSMHRLANATSVALGDLKEERFVLRTYCESTPMVLDFLRAQGINVERRHETGAESDLIALLEAGVGVALLPRSTKAPETLLRLMVEKLELSRTVYLYGVAGRQRTAVASTLMKMLRACDWSRYAAAASPP
jgi:DNA-binding transcriptional LysR family regulator